MPSHPRVLKNDFEVNFQEAEKYLLSLGNEVDTMKLGLANIRRLLAELGSPHEKYLKVQVAGTNGKGSVCAFLNSICLQAGIRTGMFTSPHLVSITERVKIDGVDISDTEFARLATRIRDVSEKLLASGEIEYLPTFFEQVTAIALLAFAEAKVDLAILETGLGGRLDATTAANAEIVAITRIDLDHQKYLGDTIEEIAAEKAAIIHVGSRVIIGEQHPKAMRVVLDRCHAYGIEPWLASEIVAIEGRNPSSSKGVNVNDTPHLGLIGRHQEENAAIAITLAGTLSTDFRIETQSISRGLENARHPGRLEYIGRFLLDGAHNPAGARALRDYLAEFVHQPITLIFGAMNDKNVGEIASILFPLADTVIVTRPENSRALTPGQMSAALTADFDRSGLISTASVAEAISVAGEVTGENGTIVVTGSLYLVGEVRRILTAVPHGKTEN